MKATLLYECKDSIGEAATWLNDLGLFLWVDINGGLLHTYSPDGMRMCGPVAGSCFHDCPDDRREAAALPASV